MKCTHCRVTLGPKDWHIEVKMFDPFPQDGTPEPPPRWRCVSGAVGLRGFIEGTWFGITDLHRGGDRLRMLNHKGEVVGKQVEGGGLQIGMKSYPFPKRLVVPGPEAHEFRCTEAPNEHNAWIRGFRVDCITCGVMLIDYTERPDATMADHLVLLVTP